MRTVDVIGVVRNVTPVTEVQMKSGMQKDRRNIVIVDEGCTEIVVSLWVKNAKRERFNIKEGQVVAIKGTRVSDYSGKTLNSGDEHSQIFVEPKHKRTQELK